ncbi:hypothetical protein PA25_08780 [Pseudoalteromonas sp. A25]|uniref:late competence development ComFB family protein n=1 Tax=Pseudoalteromonas sp. A25 TaxID=116092 RepID=UPI0012604B0B|nr:late competence development ComFB family protein [Pseudoalteromonas sp. A25]BBN80893.1 hypothetical protein PA25_08780 [Pseudoalteromonas sp. A25]
MKLHDDVHNYYERIVLEKIIEHNLDKKYDEEVMADFCCTVLNQLPARYIRNDVDMVFYLPGHERELMEQRVETAIEVAVAQVAKKGSTRNE